MNSLSCPFPGECVSCFLTVSFFPLSEKTFGSRTFIPASNSSLSPSSPHHRIRRLRAMRSNPMSSREEWDPIHAEQSLTAAFAGTYVSGQWTLRLRDTTNKVVNDGVGRAATSHAHGDGGFAGWEVRRDDGR